MRYAWHMGLFVISLTIHGHPARPSRAAAPPKPQLLEDTGTIQGVDEGTIRMQVKDKMWIFASWSRVAPKFR